jgi:DNA polymerase III epsilon subunit-like protein
MLEQLKRYAEKGVKTIGFLDIETNTDNFKAQNGYIISWVLEQYDVKTGKSKTFYNVINKESQKYHNKRENLDYDAEIIDGLVDKMRECDLIITHYGTWFDIPFIRTRCQMMKKPFITHADKIKFGDTWKIARTSGSYKYNSLDNIARTLKIGVHKTKVDYVHWKLSIFGKKKHFDYILKHNFVDVTVTKKVWFKIEMTAPIPARYY